MTRNLIGIMAERRKLLLWIIVPLAAFLWFWFWRAHLWTGGDSEQWEREIHNGVWFRKRQMLSFAMMQLTFQATGRLLGWSSHLAINLVSCLSGAAAMLVCWRYFDERRDGWWSFAIMASAGFTTVFYGHIETYAQPAAILLLHLLAVRRYYQKRWPLWTVFATFSLGLWFHLVILCAFPVLLFLFFQAFRQGSLCGREIGRVVVAAAPAGLIWPVINSPFIGTGEIVGPHFIAPFRELLCHPWIVFGHHHLLTKWRFFVWNGGIAGGLALLVFAFSLLPGRQAPYVRLLFLYFLCFIVFTLVWNPDAGIQDFDLFCFPWVIACLAFADGVMRLPGRSLWVGLALGFNLLLFLIRPVVFADLGNRHYGVLELAISSDDPNYQFLLDERISPSSRNKFIPVGPHLLRALPDRGNWRRVVNVKRGECYRYEFDGRELRLLEILKE